jgi:hypothetical protein
MKPVYHLPVIASLTTVASACRVVTSFLLCRRRFNRICQYTRHTLL